jgi:hypothetical protein
MAKARSCHEAAEQSGPPADVTASEGEVATDRTIKA